MARIERGGLEALTRIHKMVALAWAAAAVGLLVRALGAARAGTSFGPSGVPLFFGIAAAGAAGTILLGAVYGGFSAYGFFRERRAALKWALTPAALAAGWAALFGGFPALAAAGFLALQIAFLVAAGACGVALARARHAASGEGLGDR